MKYVIWSFIILLLMGGLGFAFITWLTTQTS